MIQIGLIHLPSLQDSAGSMLALTGDINLDDSNWFGRLESAPVFGRNSATFNNRLHGPEWKDSTLVIGDYDLIAGLRISPLLMST